MKKLLAVSLALVVLLSPAVAAAKHTPKPLHKNTPHTYTKHHATKHPAAVHSKRKS
ncbi:MAG: hypothetical protein P4K94_03040 [Terracidiphilus sp.]|nr:hypothetical protein [Terracidiphilus sp.]